MNVPEIKDIKDLAGKRVLVRAAFNEPVAEGKILDDSRIKKVLPTLNLLKEKGAKIILISHIGREGGSLLPVYDHLKEIYPDLEFIRELKIDDSLIEKTRKLQNGGMLLLENLRQDEREEKNSDDFAKELSMLGDIYVNEDFSNSHRAHASMVGISKYIPGYSGLLFVSEIETLKKILNPEHPFVLVLGGAKFETKLPLIRKFINIADSIFVYGAPAHSFFKLRGFEIGKSLFDNSVDVSDLEKNEKIFVPTEVVVGTVEEKIEKDISEVLPDDRILDAGPKSVEAIIEKLKGSKIFLWNGPLGDYEHGFGGATDMLAKAVVESETFSILGGGDTITALSHLNIEDKFSFVSTGGGAMLEFLAEGTLPGIEALKK